VWQIGGPRPSAWCNLEFAPQRAAPVITFALIVSDGTELRPPLGALANSRSVRQITTLMEDLFLLRRRPAVRCSPWPKIWATSPRISRSAPSEASPLGENIAHGKNLQKRWERVVIPHPPCQSHFWCIGRRLPHWAVSCRGNLGARRPAVNPRQAAPAAEPPFASSTKTPGAPVEISKTTNRYGRAGHRTMPGLVSRRIRVFIVFAQRPAARRAPAMPGVGAQPLPIPKKAAPPQGGAPNNGGGHPRNAANEAATSFLWRLPWPVHIARPRVRVVSATALAFRAKVAKSEL